jgi:hypothetical protein
MIHREITLVLIECQVEKIVGICPENWPHFRSKIEDWGLNILC